MEGVRQERASRRERGVHIRRISRPGSDIVMYGQSRGIPNTIRHSLCRHDQAHRRKKLCFQACARYLTRHYGVENFFRSFTSIDSPVVISYIPYFFLFVRKAGIEGLRGREGGLLRFIHVRGKPMHGRGKFIQRSIDCSMWCHAQLDKHTF